MKQPSVHRLRAYCSQGPARRQARHLQALRIRRSAGFTLTELLISLVLGLFTVSAVISVLVGGSETFRTTDALSRMQENGRFALEIMRRDLRGAGFTGCRRTLQAELPRPPAVATPLDVNLVRNTLNPAPAGGADALSFAFNFAEPILGYEATGDGTGAAWVAGDVNMPAAAANPLVTNALDDSDIVIATTARGPGVGVSAQPAPPNFEIPINAGSDIAVGDVVMLTDCSRAVITEVTGTGGGVLLSHAVGPGTPGNYKLDFSGPSFGPGSEVFPVERVAYYIANSPVTGRSALFRNGQEIASDIEDLEVEYGIDINADLRIDQYVDAANVAGAGVPGPPWEGVLATRVHLLISSGEENSLAEQPVAGLNYAGGTFNAPAGDRRLYQVFSATISIRNRLP